MADGLFSYQAASQGSLASEGLFWFDEYDNAGAGRLSGPADRSRPSGPVGSDEPGLLAGDGAFDTTTQLNKWSLSYESGCATKTLDGGTARINVTAAGGLTNYLSLLHPLSVTAGTPYTLSFRARADRPLTMGLTLHKWSSPWNAWADLGSVALDTSWKTYELPCTSSGTDPAAMLRMMLGKSVGTVSIDDVKFQTGRRADVYRRDYDNGIALVNPTERRDRLAWHHVPQDQGHAGPHRQRRQSRLRGHLAARDGILLPATAPTRPHRPSRSARRQRRLGRSRCERRRARLRQRRGLPRRVQRRRHLCSPTRPRPTRRPGMHRAPRPARTPSQRPRMTRPATPRRERECDGTGTCRGDCVDVSVLQLQLGIPAYLVDDGARQLHLQPAWLRLSGSRSQ